MLTVVVVMVKVMIMLMMKTRLMMMRRKERERLILMGLVLVMRVYMSRKVVEEDSREAIRLPHHKKLLYKNCLEWLDCRILLNRKVY